MILIMKKLICIAVLLMLAVKFNNQSAILKPTDLFDRIMTQQYSSYNNWPERSKNAFKKKFYQSREPHHWLPDNWPDFNSDYIINQNDTIWI